ncbi:MAG: LysR family transcriptional regulator [Polyangiaceae bacterium]|nr:LysR family transcriptional regulator [Polyangiaceae bacterium]
MLAELRAFLLVVDEGSFLSAATRLGVSRSTLRRQVDALEVAAGAPLIERGPRGVALTEAGARLARGGRAMQRDFGALLSSVRDEGGQPAGDVRVHLPTALHPGAVAALYGALRAGWPGVRVHATFSDAPDPSRLTDVDVALWFGAPTPGDRWVQHRVLDLRQRLLAHPSYLATRGAPRVVEDLASHDVLAWLAPGEREPRVTTAGGAVVPVSATIATMNAHVVHEIAHLGLGIAWAPDGELPPGPAQVALVQVLKDEIGRDVTLWMGVPRAISQLPRIRVFLENFEHLRALVFAGGARR